MPTRSVTITADQLDRAADVLLGRTARATDRVDPDTGEVLDEHAAMEKLVGLEALVAEKDRQIADVTADLKALKLEREAVFDTILKIVRIPVPAPTPLFDGDPR